MFSIFIRNFTAQETHKIWLVSLQHVFKMEQEEYMKEGIDWKEIKFVDNQPLLVSMFLWKIDLWVKVIKCRGQVN